MTLEFSPAQRVACDVPGASPKKSSMSSVTENEAGVLLKCRPICSRIQRSVRELDKFLAPVIWRRIVVCIKQLRRNPWCNARKQAKFGGALTQAQHCGQHKSGSTKTVKPLLSVRFRREPYGSRRFGPRNRYVVSRIEGWCSISISTRLRPMPNPPCAGIP